MTDPSELEFRAQAERVKAAIYKFRATQSGILANSYQLAAAIARIEETIRQGTDREIAEHPDLAEVNVYLDGYYEK
ncbi:hypothetical protein [Streptomyces sp. NPDC002067]